MKALGLNLLGNGRFSTKNSKVFKNAVNETLLIIAG
jgi:hypothetical protein